MALYALRRPELKFPAFTPQTPPPLAGGDDVDIFWAMRDGDVLLHHPYDSFSTTVEAFVAQAARDPHVLAIKQTLYRTGGDEAGIVASLVKAAEAGKQVVALVELKARFEEQANIERARMLEQAGAHVVYGLVGLKTHAKILLVVRQEADGIRRYCHVGTGNYNPKTAVIYEDLGVLSVDDELGDDISELFNHLTGYSRPGEYGRLLVAPMHLRDEFRSLIRGQARPDGVITMKMNALVDAEIIDELCAASVAGARVDIVVRGICCLRPGVPGVSERHHRALDRRPLPRALADLPLRRARPRRHRVRHRFGRHDAAQPRPPRRGDAARHRPPAARPARRDPRAQLRRRRARVAARSRRHLGEGSGRAAASTRRSRCRSSRSRGRRRAASTADRDQAALGCASPTSSARRSRRRSRGSTPTSPRSGPNAIPKRCTRRASRPAACVPTSARCATSSTRDWAHQLRAELRWLGAELGAVRDIEVLRERLTLHAALLPDADADAARGAIRRLDADHAAARTDLLARAARSPRYAQLHRALHDAVDVARGSRRPPTRRAIDALPGAVRPTWRRLRRAVDDLGAGAVRRRAARGAHPRQALPLRGRAREPGDRAPGARLRGRDDPGAGRARRAPGRGGRRRAGSAKTAPECSPPEAYALGMLAEIERGLAVRARAGVRRARGTRPAAPRLRSWL